MDVKIHDSRMSQLTSAYQQSSGRVKDNKQVHHVYAESVRDGVSISQEALQRAREAQETGAEREARIESVKQSIQDGTYRAEARDIVKKMLSAYGEPFVE